MLINATIRIDALVWIAWRKSSLRMTFCFEDSVVVVCEKRWRQR